MSEVKKDVAEPSMEEILSSIRKIIADEEDTAQAQPATSQVSSARPATMTYASDDVLELTDRIDDEGPDGPASSENAVTAPQSTPSPSPTTWTPRPSPDPSPKRPNGDAAPPNTSIQPPAVGAATSSPHQESAVPEGSPLVSNDTAAMSAAAFNKLARAAAPAANETPLAISGMTVEQLLMSMLEPMLKEWFDKHLPQVVERIVEEEVKKLVKRAELQ